MSFLSNLICHFTVTLNAVDWGSLPVKLHKLAGKSPSQISSLAERAGCKLYKVKKYIITNIISDYKNGLLKLKTSYYALFFFEM